MYHRGVRFLLFGRGYMASQFLTIYPDATVTHADIADRASVTEALEAVKPDVVINCAGRCGKPNVDWCEDHKEETLRSNVTGPLILLEECGKRDLYWVHLSSGCIYHSFSSSEPRGRVEKLKAFTEDDPPNFFGSFYSRTKAWSDQILQEFPVLQLRLRMPFDATPHPRNLITKVVRYTRVLDVENSLTSLPDFLRAAASLIGKRRTGTYNVVNPGTISPYRIAELYREIVDPTHPFERLTLQDLPSAVKAGRSNCILSTSKLEVEGIKLRPVEEAVREVLESYKEPFERHSSVTLSLSKGPEHCRSHGSTGSP